MVAALKAHFTAKDHAFLNPDWTLFKYPDAANLPAIRWKLQNIAKLATNKEKHAEQLSKLEKVLDKWLVDPKD